MSVNNPFEAIKKIIRDETNQIGQVVSNLHGVVEEKRIVTTEQVGQNWYILTAFTERMPTLFAFADAYAEEVPGYEEKQGVNGVVRYPERGIVQPGRAVLFYTTIRLSGPVPVPVKVDAPGYEIAIYVDKNRIKSGREALSVSPTLNPGVHGLAILLFGGLNTIRVQIPPGIETIKQEPMPEAPIWYTRPESIYLNAQLGSMINRLQWLNDPFASAWQVYRAETEEIAEIGQQPTDNGDGTVTIHFDNLDLDVSIGEDFYTKHFYAGRIVDVETGIAGDNLPYTRITVRVSLEAPDDLQEWIGEYYLRPGPLQSLTRVTYSGTDVIQWDDTDVKHGRVYVYAVTAFGIINQSTESDYSKLEWALSTDETPPGPIEVKSVVVSRDQVYVDFVAPEDEDYYGVRVYGPFAPGQPVEFTADKRVKIEYGEPGMPDQLNFKAPNLGVYYLVSFDVVGNQQYPADAPSFTYDGPNYSNVPGITVTPGAPTATHLPVDWQADADEVSVVAVGTVLEFEEGDASSKQGKLKAVRPAAGTAKGTVTFTATKYGITIVNTVDVPPVDVNVPCPDLEVVQQEADGLKVIYTATATNPSGGGTPQMEVELVECEAVHYDSSGTPNYYSHSDIIPFSATDELVVIRPPVGVTTAKVIFRAWNQGTNGLAQVVKIYEIFEAPVTDRQQEPLTASILLDADPDPQDPENTWIITISVLPTYADVRAKLNGEEVELTPGDEEGEYTYVLTRSYMADQKLVVHATGPGILPATASFTLDRDDEPGLSSVSISYRADRAVITAIADDDAVRLRFGRRNEDTTITYFPDATGEDVSGNASNGKTAVLDVVYNTGESLDYFIEVTDDPNGVLRWREVWRQRVSNPSSGGQVPPQIQIYILKSNGQWDERYEVRVQINAINPSGAGVDLYYKIGAVQDPATDDQGWTFVPPNERPKTLIFYRDQANRNEQHILRVKAVNQDNGLEDMDIFSVDFDSDPELSSIDVYPRFAATQEQTEQGGFRHRIVGWAVSGTADDDTRSVKIEVSGNLKIVNPANQQEVTTIVLSTEADKTFDVDLNQDIGGLGDLTVTPYSGPNASGVAGKPYRTQLSRSPISFSTIRELSQTDVEITLTAIPDSANIYYRIYRDGETPGQWILYTAPFVFIRSTTVDTIVEYYAEMPGATPEEAHRVIIDPDDDAEVQISTVREEPAGVLVVSVVTDDDVMLWRLWTRKGAWPTEDGTLNSQPNNAYMRYEGDRSTTIVQHRATAGQWYVIARGYDETGRPASISTAQITIGGDGEGGGGVTTPAPALTKVGVTPVTEPGGVYHYVYWHHNDLLEQDYSGARKYVVAVQRSLSNLPGLVAVVPITDDRHPAEEWAQVFPGGPFAYINPTPNFGVVRAERVTPAGPLDPKASYVTYRYRITIWENIGTGTPVLRGEYEAMFSGYYDIS